MYLMDVNVLVYAYREDVAHHDGCRSWLEGVVNNTMAFGYSELVLSGFLRVVTHPRIFEIPSDIVSALRFINQIKTAPNAVCIAPGSMHWSVFIDCIEKINAKGNDIPDAYHAALALEWHCDWVTLDKGFKRFKGLACRSPLDL